MCAARHKPERQTHIADHEWIMGESWDREIHSNGLERLALCLVDLHGEVRFTWNLEAEKLCLYIFIHYISFLSLPLSLSLSFSLSLSLYIYIYISIYNIYIYIREREREAEINKPALICKPDKLIPWVWSCDHGLVYSPLFNYRYRMIVNSLR